nr:hypothetical transcript [Hymenolepis microstoma]
MINMTWVPEAPCVTKIQSRGLMVVGVFNDDLDTPSGHMEYHYSYTIPTSQVLFDAGLVGDKQCFSGGDDSYKKDGELL